MGLPRLCVVDTNVPIVANLLQKPDDSNCIDSKCILECIKYIKHVTTTQALVIDEGNCIFNEYMKHLTIGEPGVGNTFMKWVMNSRHCLPANQNVRITEIAQNEFEEFPKDPRLADFDPSDKKFVAVAIACSENPSILQATDCKWIKWAPSLKEKGIEVKFLCPDYVKANYEKKSKRK